MHRNKKVSIKIPKLAILLTIVAPTLLVIILVFSYTFFSRSKTEQINSTYNSLLESSSDKATYFTDQLNFNINLLRALTSFPDIYNMDLETQATFFSSRAEILNYGQFFVVDTEGKSYYFKDQQVKDQSREPFFANIMQNETYITDPFYTAEGPIITICTAIRTPRFNRVGTLCATFNLQQIQKLIKDTGNSSTHSFIMNSEGKYIAVDSFGDINDQNSLYTQNGNNLSLVESVFDTTVNQTGIIKVNGKEYYAAAVYISKTNWVLIECTETDTILDNFHMIQVGEILFSAIVINLIFVIFLIVHSWRKNFLKLHTDSLCGCGSRAACYAQLSSMENAKHGEYSILYMDLNNFKYVNDTFGHENGDLVLTIFSDVLVKNLGSLGFVGRLGGDEFVGLFKDIPKIRIDTAIAKIENDLEKRSQKLPFDYKIEASYGYSEYDGSESVSVEDVLRDADNKMYLDKRERKEK